MHAQHTDISGASNQLPVCDVHGHYLFQIDDGSMNLNMSVELVRRALDQGVRDIFCTSHNWGRWRNYFENFSVLAEQLKEEGLPVHLHPGCEIYCDPDTFDEVLPLLQKKRLQPMGNSHFVLLEFNPYVRRDDLFYYLTQVRNHTEYTPIIAHIERYYFLHEDEAALDRLQEWGIPIQVNAYSFAEESDAAVRLFAQKMLQRKQVTFIGSDTHRTSHRPPRLRKGVQFICEHCDPDFAADVCYRNAERYLLGK